MALLFERNASAIVAILGTLKSGKTYVALDRAHPPDRLGAILQDAQVRLIITNYQNLALAQTIVNAKSAQPGEIKILNLDDLDDSIATENLGLTIASDAFATRLSIPVELARPKV